MRKPTRFHLLSDLHLEHVPVEPVPVAGDVLLLAGDIVNSEHVLERLGELTRAYRDAGHPVLMVPGNHEFYGSAFNHTLWSLGADCQRLGVQLLVNRAVIVGGVRVIGATLWTDFALFGEQARDRALAVAGRVMNDYRVVWIEDDQLDSGLRRLQPEDTARFHAESVRFIMGEFARFHAGPSIVMTHHAPHPLSIHPRFLGKGTSVPSTVVDLNPAFASNLEALVRHNRPALWVHGHTHDSFDYQLGATRVVANPRGYPVALNDKSRPVFENRAFQPELVLEV